MRNVSRTHRLAALLWLAACATGTAGSAVRPDPVPVVHPYAEELVRRALASRLDRHPQWLRLGHYRPGKFAGSVQSEADGPAFFLSARGKLDPRAELVATLRGFFRAPVEEQAKGELGPSEHPLCRFPARFAFLRDALGIALEELPRQRCPRFAEFLRELDPASVSVIFSSYYLNNPASAFGHTFLRFNKRGLALGERKELLDYAVDFSADVDTGNALVYALKGLTGRFPGTLKRVPYYYKVRQYGDHESRDIWEYELDLTPKELFLLAAHVWELGSTWFAYYYLDENCSYRIDMMIEVVDPKIELMRHLESPVLPADTVQVLFENPGLVKKVSYRPSLRTRFQHGVRDLDDAEVDAMLALVGDEEARLPEGWSKERQARVFDSAVDLLDVRHVKDLTFGRDSVAAEHKRRLLERRSALAVVSDEDEVEPPWDRRPELGHASKRFGLAGGVRDGGEGFVALDFRLAMHDLADPSDGYPELSQIEFLPLRASASHRAGELRLRLDEVSIVRIVSLTSLGRFDLSPSWHADAGARTLVGEGCGECLAAKGEVGAGPALAFAGDALTIFAFVDTQLFASGALGGIAEGPVRLGVGPSGGVRWRLHPTFVALATGEWIWYPAQLDPTVWRVEAVLRWSYASDQALSLEGRAQRGERAAQVFALVYF